MKTFIALGIPAAFLATAGYVGIEYYAGGGDADAPDAGGGDAPTIVLELDLSSAVQLMRAGISPEPLCGAGLTPQQAQTVINDAKAHFSSEGDALVAADAAYVAARPKVDELRRLVRSGLGSQEDVAALAQAKQDLEDAEANRTAALDAAFAAATASLSGDSLMALTTIRANADAGWHLPTQYLCASHDEAGWVALRDTLDAKKVCDADGVALPDDAAAHLAEIDAIATVADAAAGIETHLAELQAAWDAALAQ